MAVVSFSSSTYVYTQFGETYNGTPQEEWDRLHDGTGNAGGSTCTAGWSEGINWDRWLRRARLAFDTSSIPDDAAITDAYIKISGTEYYRNAAKNLIIGSVSGTSFSDLKTTTDYGTWNGSGSTGTGTSTISNDQIDFNATGRSSINKTGITNLSWRYEDDTTDTSPLDSDSYNYVTISSATLYVVYQADVAKALSDSISITESFSKRISRLFSESIRIGAWIVGLGNNVIVTYSDGIKITSSNIARTLTDYVKELTSRIVMFGSQENKKNGDFVGIWSKGVKKASEWIKIPKIDGKIK